MSVNWLSCPISAQWQPVKVPQRPGGTVQTPVRQSLAAVQRSRSGQRGHMVEPPQSTSLSPPFRSPSVQLAAAHVPPVHTPLSQSVPAVQLAPAPHRPHIDVPPQSTPLSPPLATPSEQLGATRLLLRRVLDHVAALGVAGEKAVDAVAQQRQHAGSEAAAEADS